MTLSQLKSDWRDEEAYHKHIHELFCSLVDADTELKRHRDYVQNHVWGFGERSFWWLWKLICEELTEKPTLLEIGVFRGATLSVWQILKPNANIYGITPLNTAGDVWESDYKADIEKIHKHFGLKNWPTIIPEYSQDRFAIERSKRYIPYSVVYIDGSHTYEDALSDLTNYAPMVTIGGFLVVDDCNNDMTMPYGFFQGIQSVTDAKLKWLETQTDFEFVFSVVHISVWRRVK